jgi:hypothetical protein
MPTKERGTILEPQKLRELASWYREYAERAGSNSIWESRLQMAKDLEQEADDLEQEHSLENERGPVLK